MNDGVCHVSMAQGRTWYRAQPAPRWLAVTLLVLGVANGYLTLRSWQAGEWRWVASGAMLCLHVVLACPWVPCPLPLRRRFLMLTMLLWILLLGVALWGWWFRVPAILYLPSCEDCVPV